MPLIRLIPLPLVQTDYMDTGVIVTIWYNQSEKELFAMEGNAPKPKPKPLEELFRPTDGTELVPIRPDVGERPWSHEESVDAIIRRGRQLYERAQVLSRTVLEEVGVMHDQP